MSITDELREWAKTLTHWWYDPVKDEYTYTTCITPPSIDAIRLDSNILAIADRIDAEHQKAMTRVGQLLADAEKDRDYNYANWQDCKQKVLQHNITMDELSTEIERLKDELAHRIELPKDADGEHIQPSDIPHLTKANDGKRLVFCPSLELRQDGTWSLAGWTPDMYRISKPTVEDVLTEFGIDWEHESDCEDRAALLKEYASKLRLAEGEDE